MNEFELISTIQLDRLVDGELSESERREILASFDREDCGETCGWRRLALAFVEAQSLHQDLRRLAVEVPPHFDVSSALMESADSLRPKATKPEVASDRLLSANPSGNHKNRNLATAVLQLATLAACCLLAFGFGRVSGIRPGEIVITQPGVEPMRDSHIESPTQQTIDDSLIAANTTSPVESHQSLRLVLEDFDGAPTQSVDIPVVSDSDIDPVAFFDAPPSVPLAVRQALLRQGRVVHEQRQLLEIELSDGRRGVLPVSDITVVDAGTDLFQ